MYIVDFIYDDVKLSNIGCVVGSAVTGIEDSKEMGSRITLETTVNHGSYISEIINANYEDVYTYTFDIIKNPCVSDKFFSDTEITWFMRWLNRKEYNKFIPIYDDDKSFYKTFFMGTFTEVKAISICGNVVGFTLTFTSNSPFGYLDYPKNKFEVDSENGEFIIYDESEELGSIYPILFTVKCNGSGNLELHNSMENTNKFTEVKNVVNGEILTFDGIHKVITSSAIHNGLYNDFNYVFPRLFNTFKEKKNIFTISIPCEVEIEYKPIRKVGVL